MAFVFVMVFATLISVLLLVAASLIPFFVLGGGSRGFKSSFLSVSWLSLCNCFACGTFLTTCFLGLIPHTLMNEAKLHERLFGHSNHSGDQVQAHSHNKPIGWEMILDTNLMVLVGFLLIVLVEQSVFLCIAPSKSEASLSQHSVSDSPFNHRSAKKHRRNRKVDLKTSTPSSRSKPRKGQKSSSKQSRDREMFEPLVIVDEDCLGSSSSIHDDESSLSSDCGLEADFGGGNIKFRTAGSKAESQDCHAHHHHLPFSAEGSKTQNLFLMLAMSAHSIFEGIALGAQQSSAQFLKLLFSIMLHEVLCSFSYGVSLSSQVVSTKMAVVYSIILSSSIPAGIGIMALLGSLEDTSGLIVRFVLEGFSAGIFIYVACVEMLAHEFSHQESQQGNGKQGIVKGIFLVLGAFVAFAFNSLIGL